MHVYRRVMVTRYGFAIVKANTDYEALEAVKNMSSGDFDWGELDTSDAVVVDTMDEHGNSLSE